MTIDAGPPRAEDSRPHGAAGVLAWIDQGFGRAFALFLGIVGLYRFDAVLEPPWGDAAWSIFPAADFLIESGFDYNALLGMPGFGEAGPNVYPLSLMTTLVALVMAALPPPWSFVLMHLGQFALAAALLTCVYRAARAFLPAAAALSVPLATLVVPVFAVQTGSLYLELPVAALAWLAVDASARGRLALAGLCAVLACLVKPNGILAPACVVLAVLTPWGGWRAFARTAASVGLPAGAALLWSVIAARTEAIPDEGQTAAEILSSLMSLLMETPDIIAIMAVGGLTGLTAVAWPRLRRSLPAAVAAAAWMALLFPLFYFWALPFVTHFVAWLPRYSTTLVPFGVLLAAWGLWRAGGARLTAAGMALLGVFNLANQSGGLYPAFETFSARNNVLAERSFEYRDILLTQRAAVTRLEELARTYPVYVWRAEWYVMRSPRLGWVGGKVPNLEFLGNLGVRKLADFPPCFIMGPPMHSVEVDLTAQFAGLVKRSGSDHFGEILEYSHGQFVSPVFQYRRAGADCPLPPT